MRHIDLEALARTIRIMDSPNSKDDNKDLYHHFVNARAHVRARVHKVMVKIFIVIFCNRRVRACARVHKVTIKIFIVTLWIIRHTKDDDKDLYRHFVNARAHGRARELQKTTIKIFIVTLWII